MSYPAIAEGVSPAVATVLRELFDCHSSEAYSVADCLNTIAENDEEQSTDEYLLNCAEEMQSYLTRFIESIRPPVLAPKTKSDDTDPFQRLIDEARTAARDLRALWVLSRSPNPVNDTALLEAADALERHMRNNVSNRGGTVELHTFRDREMPMDERVYAEAAEGLSVDGELEFDGNTIVSCGNDPGAYVLGWTWIYNTDAKLPTHFEADIYYTAEDGQHLLKRAGCLAFDEDQAEKILLSEHWEERLDSAGCVPNLIWINVDLTRYEYTDEDGNTFKAKTTTREEAMEAFLLVCEDVVFDDICESEDEDDDEEDDE